MRLAISPQDRKYFLIECQVHLPVRNNVKRSLDVDHESCLDSGKMHWKRRDKQTMSMNICWPLGFVSSHISFSFFVSSLYCNHIYRLTNLQLISVHNFLVFLAHSSSKSWDRIRCNWDTCILKYIRVAHLLCSTYTLLVLSLQLVYTS